MKIFIPAYFKTGAMWLVEAIKAATDLPVQPLNLSRLPGVRLSRDEVEELDELSEGIYFTRSFAAADCGKLLGHRPDQRTSALLLVSKN